MKRFVNALAKIGFLALAVAMCPLAGCAVEDSSPEDEALEEASEEIGATDDVGVDGQDAIAGELPEAEDAPTVFGQTLPGQEQQADPVPLPWTGSENNEDDEDGVLPFGPVDPDPESDNKMNEHY
jgi:hypothetical protein